MELDKAPFISQLRRKIRRQETFDKFIKVLKKYKAIIAGGSVLSGYRGFEMGDLDIYVHNKNAFKLYKNMIPIVKKLADRLTSKTSVTTAYDQSFFLKNNIIYRINLSDVIDIMCIPDHIPLTDVVTNFDLTFCEVWFDGENVYANNRDHVLSGEGFLRKEYIKGLLLGLNNFTLSRIKKYTVDRGMKVTYEEVPESFIKDLEKTPINLKKKTIGNKYDKEIIATNFLYRVLISNLKYEEILEKYLINGYTKNQMLKLLKKAYPGILEENYQGNKKEFVNAILSEKFTENYFNREGLNDVKYMYDLRKEEYQTAVLDIYGIDLQNIVDIGNPYENDELDRSDYESD